MTAHVHILPIFASCAHPKTVSSPIVKSVLDRIAAAVALVVFFIPCVIIAFYIRKDGGPALYAHTRIGKNGKPFKCWKFRTMVVDADQKLAGFLKENPAARVEWNHHFKLKHDPRVTTFGAFLRRSSLDEIPQFYNVLRGEMSLVGPRPVTRRFTALRSVITSRSGPV
ncbi:MAG: sugar transferase [Bdellovibrionales bacterium]